MKKYLLLIVLCICSMAAMGQGKKCHKPTPAQEREFREFKMKYLAQEIELREDQRERFFELYDKMMAEKRQIMCKVPEMERQLKERNNVSDEEYDKFQEVLNESRTKDLEIDKKYDAEFSKFLSKKQLFKFKQAEAHFRDKMREMRKSNKLNKNKTR